MSQLQYIGPRYVPKWYENSVDQTANWEVNVEYEPLTWVTTPNNHLYLSKKTVPDNIGSPALNTEYWLDMGVFTNAQIQDLRDDLDALTLQVGNDELDISDLQGRMTTAEGSITSLNTFRTNLQSSLRYPVKNVMLIMDSYGGRTNSNSQHVHEVAAAFSGATVDCIYQVGAGVLDGSIASLVSNYSGNGSIYDTVIYIGGANDVQTAISDFSNFGSGFGALKTAIDSKFTNAKNIFVMPSSLVFKHDGTTYTTEKQRFMLLGYREGAQANRMGYVANAEYIMRNTDYLESDMIHPNGAGVNRLGRYVAQFLINGYVDVYDYAYCTLSGILPDSYTFLVQRHNGTVTLSGSFSSTLINGYNTSIAIDGSAKDLGSFNKMLVCCDGTDSGHYRANSNNTLIFQGSNGYEPGGVEIYVYNNHLYAALVAYGTGGVTGKWYITDNTITFFD